MKRLFILFISLACLHLAVFEAKAVDKDWTFDPKISSLIPKYLGLVKVINGKVIIFKASALICNRTCFREITP